MGHIIHQALRPYSVRDQKLLAIRAPLNLPCRSGIRLRAKKQTHVGHKHIERPNFTLYRRKTLRLTDTVVLAPES